MSDTDGVTVTRKSVHSDFQLWLFDQDIVCVVGRDGKNRNAGVRERLGQGSHDSRQGIIQRSFTFQHAPSLCTGNSGRNIPLRADNRQLVRCP
jgi:hypothetical protein